MHVTSRRHQQALGLAVAFLALGAPASAGLLLGPEEIVQAGGADLTVVGYSVPSYVDWNSDGLNDLLVGEGGGLDPAKVRVYLNEGTAQAPAFSSFFYVQADGGDLVLLSSG